MSYVIITIGNLLLTAAYAFLTVPNHIINGGVTSTSLLISHYLHVDISYISTPITILLLIFGRIFLGFVIFYFLIFSLDWNYLFYSAICLCHYCRVIRWSRTLFMSKSRFFYSWLRCHCFIST